MSAMMVKTVRKILTYLKHVEHMDLGRRENLQRGVMTCYLAECVQVWTVYGLPCTAHDAEFLYLSRRLTELLRGCDLSTPFYCRDSNPLLLGLLYHIRWMVLGQHGRQLDLMLPYRGNKGRGNTVAWMYRALRNLTSRDSLNLCFPYAFLYGTYREITTSNRSQPPTSGDLSQRQCPTIVPPPQASPIGGRFCRFPGFRKLCTRPRLARASGGVPPPYSETTAAESSSSRGNYRRVS